MTSTRNTNQPPPRQRRSPDGQQRPMVSIRVGIEDLAEINRRAEAAGTSRTQYMIDAAVGRRRPSQELEAQLAEMAERLERLEKRKTRKT